MPEDNNPEDEQIPDSGGDQWREMVRNEVKAFGQTFLDQFGGIDGVMDMISSRVVVEVLRQLPQIDNEAIARRAVEIASGQIQETANEVRSEIDTRAAAVGAGVNGHVETNGHAETSGHMHDDKPAPPGGYTYPTIPLSGGDGKSRLLQSFMNNPLQYIDWTIDKLVWAIEKSASKKMSTDKLATLRQIQQEDPELLSLFTPNPLGPEYTKMFSEAYTQGLRTKMGTNPYATGPGPGRPYNPFEPGGTPNGGRPSDPADPSRPLFGGDVSPNEWNGQRTEGTNSGYATLSNGPRTMAEMLGGRA